MFVCVCLICLPVCVCVFVFNVCVCVFVCVCVRAGESVSSMFGVYLTWGGPWRDRQVENQFVKHTAEPLLTVGPCQLPWGPLEKVKRLNGGGPPDHLKKDNQRVLLLCLCVYVWVSLCTHTRVCWQHACVYACVPVCLRRARGQERGREWEGVFQFGGWESAWVRTPSWW